MSEFTADQIRAELIKRELAKRGVDVSDRSNEKSFLNKMRDNLTPTNLADKSGIKQRSFLSDAASTGIGLVEGYSGGFVSDDDIRNFTGVEVPDGNMVGKLIGFIAGPGKLANMAGKGVKSLLSGLSKEAGTRVAKATAKNYVGKTMSKEAGKMALSTAAEGAVGGFLFPSENMKLSDRFSAGIVGGLMGGALGSMLGAGKGFIEAGKTLKSAKKVRGYLSKIRSRPSGQAVTDGPIYDDLKTFKKTASVDAENIASSKTNAVDSIRKGRDYQIKMARSQAQEDLINLEQAKSEIEQLFISDSDDAIKAVKKVGPEWVNAKYQWYGNTLDDIASDMAKRKVGVKVSSLSDELNEILKNRRVNIQDPYSTSNMTTSEAAVSKWVKKLNDFRSKYAKDALDPIYDNDANMMLSDVMDEFSRIRKIGDKRMMRDLDQALARILEGAGDTVSAQRIADLKREYAKFVPLRDLIENSFEPVTENVMGGRKVLGEAAKQSKGLVDKSLNVDQIRQLEKLEKELGIPFLQKLRGYGDDIDLLNQQEQALKKMLVEKITSVRSSSADALRGVQGNAQLLMKEQADKLARTQAVFDAIEAKVKENLDVGLKAIKVPETIGAQMRTAALAYLMARTLGRAMSNDR